jgi:hypothetical protein
VAWQRHRSLSVCLPACLCVCARVCVCLHIPRSSSCSSCSHLSNLSVLATSTQRRATQQLGLHTPRHMEAGVWCGGGGHPHAISVPSSGCSCGGAGGLVFWCHPRGSAWAPARGSVDPTPPRSREGVVAAAAPRRAAAPPPPPPPPPRA